MFCRLLRGCLNHLVPSPASPVNELITETNCHVMDQLSYLEAPELPVPAMRLNDRLAGHAFLTAFPITTLRYVFPGHCTVVTS